MKWYLLLCDSMTALVSVMADGARWESKGKGKSFELKILI